MTDLYCQYCKKQTELLDSKIIYGKSYQAFCLGRQKNEGRRQKVMYLLPFILSGFKAPAKPKVSGLQLVAGLNPPPIDPSALCPLPSAFVQGLIYLCRPCRAWVGVHKGTNKPEGEVANIELRELRIKAHRYFDFLWKEKLRREKIANPQYKKNKARGKAYKWLAKQLKIKTKDCHIGMFDVEKCEKTILVCRPYVEKIQSRNNYTTYI